tara:strand:- start:773 stop:970 length:198 start_codon:yes stop_codon:yes gene_type:complete
MLKFIKHNMETIGGVEIFPLISFLIFFVFFIGLFTWVMKMKKTEVNMLAQLPFEDKTQENETTNI